MIAASTHGLLTQPSRLLVQVPEPTPSWTKAVPAQKIILEDDDRGELLSGHEVFNYKRKRKSESEEPEFEFLDDFLCRSVQLAELLGPELAADWPELQAVQNEGLSVVAADLLDLDRCLKLVSQVFRVSDSEEESVKKGIAGRLGARRSLVGLDAASPRPLLARPAPKGSDERPDLGLVLCLERLGNAQPEDFAGLVDLSLWPDDGRIRAPGAKTKPGVASKPYVLNLCVDPAYRRRGLARKLMGISERLMCDIWGDSEVCLHVEDDQVAANELYERLDYVPVKYTYDKEFPYTKAEAKVLRKVTWRRKMLPAPSPNSPARTGVALPEGQAIPAASALDPYDDFIDPDEDFEDDEEDDDEDEDEEEDQDDPEDFDWVSSLMKPGAEPSKLGPSKKSHAEPGTALTRSLRRRGAAESRELPSPFSRCARRARRKRAAVSGPSKFLKKIEDLDCKCLIVVAPELEQLRTIADLSKSAEDQMGIILLNARIHGNKSRKAKKIPPRLLEYLQKEFEPSYHVRFPEQKKWPDNSIIFRQICPDGEGPWIVAVQRELVGGAVVTNEVLRSDHEPSADEISEAFERYEASDKDPMANLEPCSMDRTRNLDNYLPPASSGSTALAGIVLWIVAGICLLLTFRSATAVQQCVQACGGGCVEAGGRHVECGGHGEACFDFCRTQRDEKDCIQKRLCIEEADKEWHEVQACEKEQKCDLQGLLGTGKGFALMSVLASVLPVLGTICLSLFQEPFQMDASVLRDLYCSDYIARAMWLFGAAWEWGGLAPSLTPLLSSCARTGTVELQSSRDVRMFEKSGSTNSFSARVLETSCGRPPGHTARPAQGPGPGEMPAVRARASRKHLTEYQGWPKGIYPMSDGWVPPCYPKEEELIEYEEKMKARKKATLVKRHLCVKEPQLQRLSKRAFAQKSEYSMLAYAIAEGEYSGEGDDRSYFVIVFYEPAKKSKVERAFKSVGAALADYEQVVVDPDSKMEQEEKFMFAHGAGDPGECILGEYEYQVVPKGSPEYDDPWGPTHPEGKFWE
eukprot:s1435_g5.t3